MLLIRFIKIFVLILIFFSMFRAFSMFIATRSLPIVRLISTVTLGTTIIYYRNLSMSISSQKYFFQFLFYRLFFVFPVKPITIFFLTTDLHSFFSHLFYLHYAFYLHTFCNCFIPHTFNLNICQNIIKKNISVLGSFILSPLLMS